MTMVDIRAYEHRIAKDLDERIALLLANKKKSEKE